jgi:hypothetical protein
MRAAKNKSTGGRGDFFRRRGKRAGRESYRVLIAFGRHPRRRLQFFDPGTSRGASILPTGPERNRIVSKETAGLVCQNTRPYRVEPYDAKPPILWVTADSQSAITIPSEAPVGVGPTMEDLQPPGLGPKDALPMAFSGLLTVRLLLSLLFPCGGTTWDGTEQQP